MQPAAGLHCGALCPCVCPRCLSLRPSVRPPARPPAHPSVHPSVRPSSRSITCISCGSLLCMLEAQLQSGSFGMMLCGGSDSQERPSGSGREEVGASVCFRGGGGVTVWVFLCLGFHPFPVKSSAPRVPNPSKPPNWIFICFRFIFLSELSVRQQKVVFSVPGGQEQSRPTR